MIRHIDYNERELNIMKKKIISAFMSAVMLTASVNAAQFDWAKEAVDFCLEREIMSGMENGDLALGDNLTREQMAKMLCDAFGIEANFEMEPVFNDVDNIRWSYGYIGAIAPLLFGGEEKMSLKPEEKVTREEFCATMILAYGLKNGNLRNSKLLDVNFKDADKVSKVYKKLVTIAVERGLMSGSDGEIRPQSLLTRAEACSFLYRAVSVKEGKLTIEPSQLGVIQSENSMFGEAAVSLETAKAWAEKNGATESFIAAADLYWQYGDLSGIRPDILYAQSAKETGYGKYGGNVIPEQNNFAGIKKYGRSGDAMEDHEDFPTQEDGVRGHFNHMSAYLGLNPIGEPHERYKSVKSMPWAGSVKTLEELGGKWCPDLYYGFSILHDYIEPMVAMD